MKKTSPIAAMLATLISIAVFATPVPSMASDTPQSSVVSEDPADWTPNILDGQVNAIVQMGTKVVVGGTFTQVRRAGTSVTLTRNYLFAFDMETGVIDPNFIPQLNDQVLALAPGPEGTPGSAGGLFGPGTGVRNRTPRRSPPPA